MPGADSSAYYSQILIYIFCLISIDLSLSDDANKNKMKCLNIESA